MLEETTWLFLGATVVLTVYALFAVGFYRALHLPRPGAGVLDRALVRSGRSEPQRARARLWWQLVAIPVLVCTCAALLSVLSVGIVRDREVEDIYAVAVGVVAAVRILAFLWDEPAVELAKMVPIAVLSMALLTSSSIDGGAWRDALVEAGTENAVAYIIVLFLLEWLLQFGVPRLGWRRWSTLAGSAAE